MTPQLQATLKRLPDRPGVYLLKNERGDVLYVGKAQSLRSRVRSYWQKQAAPRSSSDIHRIREVTVRPQLDVVAEPRRLLVRVRMASKPREQRDVVDDRALRLAELQVLSDAQTQDARPQHMLHRLSEAEIRGQRHRGHELGESYLRRGH